MSISLSFVFNSKPFIPNMKTNIKYVCERNNKKITKIVRLDIEFGSNI